MPFQKKVDNLWDYLLGPLIELLFRQIGNGVGHGQKFKIWDTPGLSHRPACLFKEMGDDRDRGNSFFFK